ncbi:MAG: phosphate ABC transporter permease subunit PstC [Desulfobacterium sp. 4572_20]|nr:phosphate ABC transporter permease subunit PstC [Deltaproteobacteria bacterium]OQY17218.1 MAG: phosphate ABC transporter permease subunit PstC [Desulfobacterium sp. 4572_20]RLB23303.1 MAG: phosphate ABC transporter permease subunit PstC [Deltaproteobacteria bacterium]HDH87987.1 phosphate ABC transporter permease subunit PstC [Desulfobacteraceae bacterium]
MISRKGKEFLIQNLFLFFASISIVVLFLIMAFLFKEGLPIIEVFSPLRFLFGKSWYPTYEPPEFGILPLIMGSAAVTLGAIAIAIPLGVATAIYLSEVAHIRVKELLKPVIELLAGVPSVVYGFFGLVVVAPWVQDLFDLPTGLTALTASIMLGIMASPTVISISEDALSSVPISYREASLALGTTRWYTAIKVTVPAALSGISTACILGMARAIEETMIVLMVAGGAAVIPRTLLQPVRPMTANIIAEMGEAVHGGEHYSALFAIGVVLFFITLALNLLADFISHRFKETGSATL